MHENNSYKYEPIEYNGRSASICSATGSHHTHELELREFLKKLFTY